MKTIVTPWHDRVLVIDAEDRSLPPSVFTEDELALAGGLRLPARRHQWLWSRFAAKELAVQRGIAATAREVTVERPALIVDGTISPWFVSISHSMSYAGAAIGPAPVGLDVQVVRDLPERAAHLFLSDEEAGALRRCTIAHRLIHFWAAKEAAWKERSGEIMTLKQMPLRLVSEQEAGLTFDKVETIAIGELVVAITSRPNDRRW